MTKERLADLASELSPPVAEGFFMGWVALSFLRSYKPLMLKASAHIIERVSRGSAAVRERSRGFSSLLLLGLTRGCRVR